MRVTSSMYYRNLYGENNSKISEELFNVNKQISSGLTIQYAKDDVSTFSETMKFDNEITILDQITSSSNNGYKMSNQADVVLNDFETTTDRVKTLLISAANGTQSSESLDAIAKELRGLEEHYKNLANTSINGQFLFSGSALSTKPISDDGTYMGNDKSLSSFVGSGVQQQYNLTGAELFLGEEVNTSRTIVSNVEQNNLSAKYPDFMDKDTSDTETSIDKPITGSDTIRDLMGDDDGDADTLNTHFFYLRGTRSDGTAFNEKIQMSDSEKVDDLLTKIGDTYGNTPNLNLVDVSLNSSGQIVIEDRLKGSSKLDFHMVGAVNYGADVGGGTANVTQINDLDIGEKDFDQIANGTTNAADKKLYVKEFVKSPYTNISGVATNIDGLSYDRTFFTKDGSTLSSNVPQILKETNVFATASTKISEVADLSQAASDTLSGTSFLFTGTNVYGMDFTTKIDIKNGVGSGSTFSVDVDNNGTFDTTYDIFDMGTPRKAVDADEMTYQQLMDVINMVTTGNLPASDNTYGDKIQEAQDYDKAVKTSKFQGNTSLSYDGKIQFQEIGTTNTKASMALYDSNSGSFLADTSVMTFNANNALTVSDPKTDFFKELDNIISAVEEHKIYPDSENGDIRNVGIQNAITKLEDLQLHISKSHANIGARANALSKSSERAELLKINTVTLRSSVIDTDLAEASLKLTQLSLNYEAMLSTVGKVSKLSLVNYL